VKEDALQASLLFVGTEYGLWISPDSGRTWAEFKGGEFPSVAVRDLQVHPRDHDLVIGTHGRGIWIVDDLSPLRSLAADLPIRDVAFLPSRPVQQRMAGNGGWPEGDASFVGQNPPAGAAIAYYLRTRHLFGSLALEILDSTGRVVDTLAPTGHRGLNRVFWPMSVKPPRVPRAAQLAFNASRGPRVPPGSYTVRLTKGVEVVEAALEIGLDRRAPYGKTERKEQFDAVMRAHAVFNEMTDLTDRLDVLRSAAAERSRLLADSDALRSRLRALVDAVDTIKKKIVATKEGGMITGEERIREHLDIVYGALMSWEGRPARYQVDRVEALKAELADVAAEFARLASTELGSLNDELARRELEPIPIPAAIAR
jgi:hypothetical protein